ncbi:MAG TPA: hypothetical protein ENK18_10465 [Deltaproteobacteria bacterium]|nr:hypothetical protein [Deltaproteobacteria bacterium]
MLLLWLATIAQAWGPQLHDLRALVATEILIPRAVWFDGQRSPGFETRAWQAQVVLSCEPDMGRARKRKTRTACAVEDAALSAAPLDPGRHDARAELEPILGELATYLQQATVHLITSERGRLLSWSAEGLPEGGPQQTRIGRILAVVLERATAGLILERPPEPPPEASQWIERTSPLLRFPDLDTSQAPGVSEQLHEVALIGGTIEVYSEGQATLIDPVADLQMRARVRSQATLRSDGALLSRSFNVDATDGPTVVYHHAGWLRRLAPGEAVELGPDRLVHAPGEDAGDDPLGSPPWPDL